MSEHMMNTPHGDVDPDDLDKNTSGNPHLNDILAARLHRRHVVKGGVGAMTMAGLGSLGLAACGGDDAVVAAPAPVAVAPAPAASAPAPAASAPAPATIEGLLKFNAINKSIADRLIIADGYTATVIYATGDSISASVSDYKNDGTDDNFARRSGDHHDGMYYFGLSATGTPSLSANDRALLAINHENIAGTVQFMHPNGQTNTSTAAGTPPRPEAEAVKEIEAHGVSIIELARNGASYGYVKASSFNRRITASTLMDLAGPVRGTDFVKTVFSKDGTQTRGTINNCANGFTPWGTYLTCEENWAGYFTRGADAALRTQKDNSANARNAINPSRNGNNRWSSVVPADTTSTAFSRWDMTAVAGQPATGTGDFRNAANTFGYVVEIDPYDPNSTPIKRTALGRRANEGAWPSNPVVGRPLAWYIGDDSRGEYIYKYVSKKLWVAADANRSDRLKVGDEYLNDGTMYAARFNANGTGTWVKLDLSNPDIVAGVPVSAQNPEGYKFDSLADICVNTRMAADAAKATRMDRPEWTAVNPRNGEVYITLTENPDRGNTAAVAGNNYLNPDVDPANPRYWLDAKGVSSQGAANATQRGNINGHVMRIKETGDSAAAETFAWDIFLFGAQATADTGGDNVNYQQNVNLSGLSALNDLSKPDGCWFSRASGILWIQTDDNTYTDVTNAMLLAAIPGTQGDGGQVTVVNRPNGSPNQTVTSDKTVTTFAGKKMSDTILKRFMVAPLGAEITGLAESPDGTALFINIQHPGENTTAAQFTARTFESNWPGNGAGVPAYGPGGATARPRSATVMITKNGGGVIGL